MGEPRTRVNGVDGQLVRPLDTPRAAAAARATATAITGLRARLSAAVPDATWTVLVADRVLEGDDAHGRDYGLVVQHDEVRWTDLVAVLSVTERLLAGSGHPLPECAGSGGCQECRAVRALARLRRIWLTSGLTSEGVAAAAAAAARGVGSAGAGGLARDRAEARDPGADAGGDAAARAGQAPPGR